LSEEGIKRMVHYATRQKRIWALAKELARDYELGEPIDVILEALERFRARLALKRGSTLGEEKVDAP